MPKVAKFAVKSAELNKEVNNLPIDRKQLAVEINSSYWAVCRALNFPRLHTITVLEKITEYLGFPPRHFVRELSESELASNARIKINRNHKCDYGLLSTILSWANKIVNESSVSMNEEEIEELVSSIYKHFCNNNSTVSEKEIKRMIKLTTKIYAETKNKSKFLGDNMEFSDDEDDSEEEHSYS